MTYGCEASKRESAHELSGKQHLDILRTENQMWPPAIGIHLQESYIYCASKPYETDLQGSSITES
jgi:hypothetical protein